MRGYAQSTGPLHRGYPEALFEISIDIPQSSVFMTGTKLTSIDVLIDVLRQGAALGLLGALRLELVAHGVGAAVVERSLEGVILPCIVHVMSALTALSHTYKVKGGNEQPNT